MIKIFNKFILILLMLLFCKDSEQKTNKEKTGAISLLTIQMHNQYQKKPVITCSEANISERIMESIDKNSQGCVTDSDCMSVGDANIKVYINWGKNCYICIWRENAILKSKFESFKSDLTKLNSNHCQKNLDLSQCEICGTVTTSDSYPFCNSQKKCAY